MIHDKSIHSYTMYVLQNVLSQPYTDSKIWEWWFSHWKGMYVTYKNTASDLTGDPGDTV